MASFDINKAGFAIAAMFVAVWAAAVAFWKFGKIDRRWAPAAARPGAPEPPRSPRILVRVCRAGQRRHVYNSIAAGCAGSLRRSGVRTVLQASRPAAAWSWTAARSVSGRRPAASIRRSPASTRATSPASWAASLRANICTVRTPRPGSSGPGGGGADEGSAVGDQAHQLRGLLRAGADQVQHHAELVPGHRPQDGGGGVVDYPVGPVGADAVDAARAGGRGHGGTGPLGQLDGVPADRAARCR